jgi:hypothetical protein
MDYFKIKYFENKFIFYFKLHVPNFKIKNKLNFRIFKIKKNNNYIQDPEIEKSFYIKNINQVNKIISFEFYFDETEFLKIDEILFDYCDEGITWHNKIIHHDNISYININCKNILSENLINYLKSEEFKRII